MNFSMIPESRVHHRLADVEPALMRLFGLSLVQARDIAEDMYRAFSSATPLHPTGHAAHDAWSQGCYRLREAQTSNGWSLDNPQNQPVVVSPDGKIALTISSGNHNTGVINKEPRTRNEKGAQTEKGIRYNNAQLELGFPEVEPEEAQGASADVIPFPAQGQALWIFLAYVDQGLREVRCEISRPAHMSDKNYVDRWSDRYILPPFKFLPQLPQRDDDDSDQSPAIDISILPRKT